MAMDLAGAGSKVNAGRGGGTGPSDPFIQYTDSPQAIPLGYQQITLGATAVGLSVPTLQIESAAIYALITVENTNVRWRDDGVQPTTSIGMLFGVGSTMTYRGDLSAIQFIGDGAILDVSYYQ